MSCFLLSTLKERGQSTEHSPSSSKDNNTGNIFARKCLWIFLRAPFLLRNRGGGYQVTAEKPLRSLTHYCCCKASQTCKVLNTCNIVLCQQERRRSWMPNSPCLWLCLTVEQRGAEWELHSLQRARASPVLAVQTILMNRKCHQLPKTAFTKAI